MATYSASGGVLVTQFPSSVGAGWYDVYYYSWLDDWGCSCPGYRTRAKCQHTDWARKLKITVPYEITQDNRLVAAVRRVFAESGIDLEYLINTYTPYTWQDKLSGIAEKIKSIIVQQVIRDELTPETLKIIDQERRDAEKQAKAKELEAAEAAKFNNDLHVRKILIE